MIPQGYPLVARTVDDRQWLVVGWSNPPHPRPIVVAWESGLGGATTVEVEQPDGSSVITIGDTCPAAPRKMHPGDIAEWSVLLPDGSTR